MYKLVRSSLRFSALVSCAALPPMTHWPISRQRRSMAAATLDSIKMGPLVWVDDLQMTVHCAFLFFSRDSFRFHISVRAEDIRASVGGSAAQTEKGPEGGVSGERRLA